MPTNDTSGPLFTRSSPSADLQRSLENRLRARMDVNGSPEYALTWKHWDMPAGLPICALRASARRISGNGFGGWPTPQVADVNMSRAVDMEAYSKRMLARPSAGSNLALTAQAYAGWPTPHANSSTGPGVEGREGGANLQTVAGWATPTTRDHKDTGTMENVPVNALLGRQVTLSRAPTEKRGALNPAFSRWLQGYPVAWCQAAIRAHRKRTTHRKHG